MSTELSKDNFTRINSGISMLSRKQRRNKIIVDLIWTIKEIKKQRKRVNVLEGELDEIRKH